MPQYIRDNTEDEFTHWTFLNAYLRSRGAEPVDLGRFATLPSSTATGARQGAGRDQPVSGAGAARQRPEVLRVLLSIGPTEAMHFQTWHDKAGNAPPLTDPRTGSRPRTSTNRPSAANSSKRT